MYGAQAWHAFSLHCQWHTTEHVVMIQYITDVTKRQFFAVLDVQLLLHIYFSVQMITICAVVNLKCAPEKATCAVVICAVVKYLLK